MNILFYTHHRVCATKGGTERTTVSVALTLAKLYDVKCFSLYEDDGATPKEDCFVKEFRWHRGAEYQNDIETLHRIIVENDIDFIIDQGIFINVKILSEASEGTKCKVILAHHYEPGAEKLYMSLRKQWMKRHNLKTSSQKIYWIIKLLFYPYFKYKYNRTLRSSYYEAYKYAYRVVLLSKSYVAQYQRFGKFTDEKKFFIIPNSLSFDESIAKKDIFNKKPIVLIVSRLEEVHKRLSLALKIWEQVSIADEANGWSLKIVGSGSDLAMYKKLVDSRNIQNVTFEGQQNPLPYYKESSIFMMTSRSESWGLTLTEAQQMGVVPIAFNTYSALSEIITNGENGMIIKEGDIDSYIEQMKFLMKNHIARQTIACQAIISSQRFSKMTISNKWWELLNN